ncbi:hypothetical protein ABT158_03935 [Nonomuraea sp. NPDC001636]|uniref:hypothetical protein n=1 Tax=Nonomuraea sp. NPDC001636 TaxID=3154391 RepID=UPI003322CA37
MIYHEVLLTAFLYVLGAVVALVGIFITVIATTCTDLIKTEAQTRLERVPTWLLHRAANGLAPECRQEILEGEWLPELAHISRESEGLPITRFVRSVRFAVGLMGGPAWVIGSSLKGVRKPKSKYHERLRIARGSQFLLSGSVRELADALQSQDLDRMLRCNPADLEKLPAVYQRLALQLVDAAEPPDGFGEFAEALRRTRNPRNMQ